MRLYVTILSRQCPSNHIALQGRPSFCPRLLVFDKKGESSSSQYSGANFPTIANFGTLAKTNALLGSNEDELPDEDFPAIWYAVSDH